MRLLNLIEDDLMELRQRWKAPSVVSGNDTQFLAFRGDYWLLGGFNDEKDIPDNVVADIVKHTGLDPMEFQDSTALMSSLSDIASERPDIITGLISDGEMWLGSREAASHHPQTSSMLKKLIKDLGLYGIHVEDTDWEGEEAGSFTNRYKVKGELPKVLFHGTTSQYMMDIAKTGIRPGINASWEKAGITHKKIIFGTVDIAGAIFHANKASGFQGGEEIYADPDDPFPVILEFAIPDPSKIVPDYDVASQMMGSTTTTNKLGYTGQRGFDSQHSPDIQNQNPEGRAWKSTGIFGYVGRIPPSYIIRVHTDFHSPEVMSDPSWRGTLKQFLQGWASQQEEYNRAHEDEDNEDS